GSLVKGNQILCSWHTRQPKRVLRCKSPNEKSPRWMPDEITIQSSTLKARSTGLAHRQSQYCPMATSSASTRSHLNRKARLAGESQHDPLLEVLKKYWGFDDYLPLQREAMQCVM